MTDKDITVQDVFDDLTQMEKDLLYQMVGEAVRHKRSWRLSASFGYTTSHTYLHLNEIQRRVFWYIIEESVNPKWGLYRE